MSARVSEGAFHSKIDCPFCGTNVQEVQIQKWNAVITGVMGGLSKSNVECNTIMATDTLQTACIIMFTAAISDVYPCSFII